MNNKLMIAISMILFYLTISIPVFIKQPFEVCFLGFIYLLLSQVLVLSVIKKENIKNNAIAIFAFSYFFVYMTFSQLYLLYQTDISISDYTLISIILYIAIVLLLTGYKFGSKIKIRKIENKEKKNKYLTYLILLTFSMIVTFIQIHMGGGLRSYFMASYQNKFNNINDAKFIGGISKLIVPFTYYNLLYLNDKNSVIRLLSRLYLIFNIGMIIATGSSLRILYIIISLIFLKLFLNEHKSEFKVKINKKILRRGFVFIIIGIIIAILIRFNRSSDKFSFNVLSNAYEYLISSSTFDSLYFFWKVVKELDITYSMGQFIFPLIFWIPRSVFITKPTELGRIVAIVFRKFNNSIVGGFAVSPMAEFYYDLGYIGIILGMFFIGFIISIIQKVINNKITNKEFQLATILMFMFATVSLPASWISMGTSFVSCTIFIALKNILDSFSIKRR